MKVPKNKKFDHIKTTLNTGSTVKNIEYLSDKYIAKKKSEPYKRLKGSTLIKLLQVNSYNSGRAIPRKHLQNRSNVKRKRSLNSN